MQIAQIQKLANKSQVVNQKEPIVLEKFFAYLNSLITSFQSANRNFFGEMEIDFQEPLKVVANDLQLEYKIESKTETADSNLVRNLNVIDFGGFLDTVIRTVAMKNSNLSNLKDLAAKNIFRTHINKPVLEKLQSMFFKNNLKPETRKYSDSLSSSQIAVEVENLQRLMSDPQRNHFYIFDIDGTLKHNEENCLTHDVPNISNRVRSDLIALTKKPNTKVLILTSRGIEEIRESNIPYKQIPVIGGYGREAIHGKEQRFLVGHELIKETGKFTKHLHRLLKSFGIKEKEYVLRQYAGSISIQFKKSNFSSAKVSVMRELELLMQNKPRGWSVIDIGNKTIFFANEKFEYHKGMAMEKILEEHKSEINENTNIYVLGDTSSDYKAMQVLKEAESELPIGTKTINIAVGDKLPKGKYPAVDEKISSHHALVDLLGWLAV